MKSSMLTVYLLFSNLYLQGDCGNIKIYVEPKFDRNLEKCITNILAKYFSEDRGITYVDINSDINFLRTIHSSTTVSLITRQLTTKSTFSHSGYLITSKHATEFSTHVLRLTTESTWNPYARFLIIITSLNEENLKQVFDTLLKLRVINVVLVNGTTEAHLYSYDPFYNYACGRYYDNVINNGGCLKTMNNLYPDKLITKLRNCTFTATTPHRPPFTIDPSQATSSELSLGIEQYILLLIAKSEQFKIRFDYNYGNTSLFATITPDMQASEPFSKLQNNVTDIMLGNLMLTASRAEAFTYLHGQLDYTDELKFIVKKAPVVEGWKYFYLIFSAGIWSLLLISFIIYSWIILLLLKPKDKVKIIVSLFESLLSHSCNIKCKLKIKYLLMMWVVFTSLVNSYYSSTLVSLTTNPMTEYQVSTEDDLIKYNLIPCISLNLETFLSGANNRSFSFKDECMDAENNLKFVSKSRNVYTLVRNYRFVYSMKVYIDEYGESTVHCFKKPYAKYMIVTLFYKGFPITDKMQVAALHVRESGLVQKVSDRHYFATLVKMHYRHKEQKTNVCMEAIPWHLYIAGCTISVVAFILEVVI